MYVSACTCTHPIILLFSSLSLFCWLLSQISGLFKLQPWGINLMFHSVTVINFWGLTLPDMCTRWRSSTVNVGWVLICLAFVIKMASCLNIQTRIAFCFTRWAFEGAEWLRNYTVFLLHKHWHQFCTKSELPFKAGLMTHPVVFRSLPLTFCCALIHFLSFSLSLSLLLSCSGCGGLTCMWCFSLSLGWW